MPTAADGFFCLISWMSESEYFIIIVMIIHSDWENKDKMRESQLYFESDKNKYFEVTERRFRSSFEFY